MIPGGNLLTTALSIIKRDEFTLHAWTGTVTNAAGADVQSYNEAGVKLFGSVQAVPRSMYEQLGLDFNSRYINIWHETALQDVGRDRPSDQVTFGGKRHDLIGRSDWTLIDGWNSVMAVELNPS